MAEYGKVTYRRIMNATSSELANFLISNGYREYTGYSRLYLAELFQRKAKDRKAEYYI